MILPRLFGTLRALLPAACATGAVGLLPLAPGATAQSLADATAAYTEGRFLDAADLGEALGNSEGLTLAAMSLAIYAYYEASDEEWQELIERAIRAGEAAVEADSSNAEAHYQQGHAVGRYAQGVGAVTALREGLAGRIRDLFEASLALRPDHPSVLAALGAWHVDVAAEGRIARWMYGGDRDEGVRLMERALELAPESKVVLYTYGARLAGIDDDNGVERARALLEKALSIPPADYYEDYVHLEILDALDALDKTSR